MKLLLNRFSSLSDNWIQYALYAVVFVISYTFAGKTFTLWSTCFILLMAWQNQKETNKEEVKKRHDLEETVSIIAKDYDLVGLWKKKYGHVPGTRDQADDLRGAINMGEIRRRSIADILFRIGGEPSGKK